MRILQVGVPFTIVGRSRKSWIRWNRNGFRGRDAMLRAHSGIGQQTSPPSTVSSASPTYPDAFSLKLENHDRSLADNEPTA